MLNEKAETTDISCGQVETIVVNAVEEYQCPGCACGRDISCYEKSDSLACKRHRAGSIDVGIGKIFPGMPRGFDRLGDMEKTEIHIFKNLNDGWGYNKFNVPVWKYLDEHNNTIMRGMCPRINCTWIHIFLENCIDKIECLEITNTDIDDMD